MPPFRRPTDLAGDAPLWRELLLGAVVGLLGFAINQVPLSVGWDRDVQGRSLR